MPSEVTGAANGSAISITRGSFTGAGGGGGVGAVLVGVAERDAGVAGRDAGVAGRDAGVAGRDAGVAGRDAGVAAGAEGCAALSAVYGTSGTTDAFSSTV